MDILCSEFNKDSNKCKSWLREHHPVLFGQVYPEEAIAADMASTSLQDLSKSTDPSATTETKQQQQPSKKKKVAPRQLTLKISERGKRKRITTICGLEQYGQPDMKKAAKQFSSKFACGASVNKTAEGKEEITIQGDVSDALIRILVEQYSVPEEEIVRKEK